MRRFSYRPTAAVVGAIATSLALAAPLHASSRAIHPDDRARHRREVMTRITPVVHPDDRARHGRELLPAIDPVTVTASVSNGFDWADAGIGAATVAGLALIGGGAFLVVLRRRGVAFS